MHKISVVENQSGYTFSIEHFIMGIVRRIYLRIDNVKRGWAMSGTEKSKPI